MWYQGRSRRVCFCWFLRISGISACSLLPGRLKLAETHVFGGLFLDSASLHLRLVNAGWDPGAGTRVQGPGCRAPADWVGGGWSGDGGQPTAVPHAQQPPSCRFHFARVKVGWFFAGKMGLLEFHEDTGPSPSPASLRSPPTMCIPSWERLTTHFSAPALCM